MGKDREYYLKRVGEEQARAETATDAGARLVHGRMAKLYAERAGDGTETGKDGPATTPGRRKLFVVRE